MNDRTIIVYWRWAWLGILPGAYISAQLDNNGFLFLAIGAYIASGLNASLLCKTVSLPAATIGAVTWAAFMVFLGSKHLPLAEMWEARGELAIWAAAYVGGGAAAVLFLGLSLDPIFRSSPKTSEPQKYEPQKSSKDNTGDGGDGV